MTDSKLFRRLAAAAAVLAVGGSAAVLLDGAANAASREGSLGSLTITPTAGTDLSIPRLTTPTGCPDTANSFQVETTGPNGFDYFSVGTQSTNLSHTGPFSIEFETNMKDESSTIGVPLVTGEYDVVMRCVDDGTLQSFGDFTGALTFNDPTHYTVFRARPGPSSSPKSNPSPTSSPNPTGTTSDTVSPAPTGMTGIGGANTPSDTGGGTQPLATTGTLANIGAPIGVIVGGVILLAVGLALVVWRQRKRTRR